MQKKSLIYEVKCSICGPIYMGNTQKIFHRRVERRMSSMQHVDGHMGYRNIPRRKVPGRRRNGDNVDLHLQTSEYGSCYIATRPILDLCLEVEHRPVSRVPKLVVTRILKFSQRNGKLPLPQLKQGHCPVITIYDVALIHFVAVSVRRR